MNYIFGYGSLINSNTRDLTGKTEEEIPVEVEGFIRRWNVHIERQSRSTFGLEERKDSKCNGVLISVTDENLAKFDQRESPEYTREEVNSDRIITKDNFDQKKPIWIYLPKNAKLADKENPIVQSYLDVTIAGCLQAGKQFTKKFLETTIDWGRPWLNDRDNPRYPRYLENLPITKIDKLLSDYKK